MTLPPPEPPLLPSGNGNPQDAGSPSEPPPLPPNVEAPNEQETLLDKSKGFASQFAATAKSAALLTAKQTERAKIQNVSLPQAFAALGKHVYSADSHREDFDDLFGELDALYAKVEELETRVKSRPSGENMTDKAKAVAASAKDKAEAQSQRPQIARVRMKLGKAAHEKHGNACGPEDLLEPIEQLLARREVLDAEIDELANESEGQLVTPKRVALGGLFCVLAVIAAVGFSWLNSDDDNELSDFSNPADVNALTDNTAAQGLIASSSFPKSISGVRDADRFVGKPLTITGNQISVVDLDGRTQLHIIDTSLGMDAICWFRADAVKELYASNAATVHVTGEYNGVADVGRTGRLEFVNCRLVSDEEMASIVEATKAIVTQSAPAGSRPLEVRIGTAVDTPSWIHNNFNPSLQDVKCHATADQIIIDFAVNTDLWLVNGARVGWRLPLIIRLADRNGNILKHFTTPEGFTVFPEVHQLWQNRYEMAVRSGMPAEDVAANKIQMLQPRANQLVYSVNMRDLRDAAIVEVGFYQER